MILNKFYSAEDLEIEYKNAALRKINKHDSAAHVLSRELEIDVKEIRSVLNDFSIHLLGHDATCSKELAKHRSTYMKDIWKGRDDSWRKARGEKYSNTWSKKPDDEIEAHKERTRITNLKIAKDMIDHPEKEEKRIKDATAWMKDKDRHKKAIEKGKDTRRKRPESRKNEIHTIYCKSNKKRFASMTLEDRRTWALKTNGRKYSILIDGKRVRFDSSWEEIVYRFFLKFKIPFLFSSTDKTGISLGDILWAPDFILEDLKLIIDVKGHPKAWEKFNNVQYPRILKCKDTTLFGYSILLVDKIAMNSLSRCNSIEDLLKLSLWVLKLDSNERLNTLSDVRFYSGKDESFKDI